MFGESDSESPRVPSPWDSLTPTPSPPKHNGVQAIPKLVPEVEEGNVEYKLQLLGPSPARFARLVTQLKWRLLEGGGQAYYELGVADSGTLVGLPRQQLEASLETLEMMASEIDASVIVVKEIAVPPELSNLAESQLERWDGRRSTRRKDLLRMMKQDASPITSPTEFETELSSTDVTDADESTCHSPTIPPASPDISVQLRPSPPPLPFDPALAMLTLDVGEDIADYADYEATDGDVPTDFVTEFSVSLEISSVYKPRPMKKRATHVKSPPSHFEYVNKKLKSSHPLSKSIDTTRYTGDPMAQDSFETPSQPKGAKSRNKRRELKHKSLLTHVSTHRSTESPANFADHHTAPSCSMDEPNSSVLESLTIAAVDSPTADTLGTLAITSKEPRLIVEALVVRKLSLDEAFLDFEGFSLQ
ncbi:hypothetical protein J3R82DRAFT_1831 [Butyriboletus roseoflavus]|nr:hypothetical protein J3R82DRAFT_1831 [Butyriboletus roseoflavus]